MSIENKSKKNCSGCAACKNICEYNAIEMKADTEGFLYPIVDNNKCCECELCIEVCPFTDEYKHKIEDYTPSVFAVTSKYKEETKNSSSAGVGYLLGKTMINEGGVVYGASFSETFEVYHSRADSLDGIRKFSGSKYVQSNIVDIFKSIENDLKQGTRVLFIGTACQTAGIRSYLRKPLKENLLTCDILCYGVPSPLIFKEYLNMLSNRYRSKIKNVVFRSKTNGWASAVSGQKVEFENGKVTNLKLFTRLFFDHIILRPSCTNCVYTTKKKPSDITIADFWDIKKFEPKMYDRNGVSMVLIHNDKGRSIFERIKNSLHCKELDDNCCVARQFFSPAEENKKRYLFWDSFQKQGIRKTLFKYKLKYFIRSCIQRMRMLISR